MTAVSEVLAKMTENAEGNLNDIMHFMKVWGFAKTIGKLENLDERTQYTLELAAIVHDISCPICRKKYGNTGYKHQEEESTPLVSDFFKDLDIPKDIVERIAFIVSHHHTYNLEDGLDYQILLEADFIVNAKDHNLDREPIENTMKSFYKTKSGKALLESIYLR
ncbi:MAG: HD domain-containing protein [Treponema sp.]|nr:HD domain-containing protein [Treponema sp.]